MKPKSKFTWYRHAFVALTILLLPGVIDSALAAADCGASTCDICVGAFSTHTVSGSETANCVEVEAGGLVKINPHGRLTLTGPGPSCVDGDVLLKGNASLLAFTTNSHTVTGTGKIVGQSNSAQIVIDGVTLTSEIDITGRLHMKDGVATGTFQNDGCVTANAPNGALNIEVTGIDDTAGACWRVIATGAALRFVVEPAFLDGDFTITGGALIAGTDAGAGLDDIDVCTSGDLTHSGGQIVAGNNDSFCFNCTCP